MHFPSTFLAIVATLLSTLLVSAAPIACTDATRDAILSGKLDPSACCPYGVCKGDVNIEGGFWINRK
ncbi:hypothetical protein B0O99DRAFT_509672 [Bisporella sp. PMI_857]|nr:hypothetical protein B0O99DRAFT_509672 [Bisporella sp. PMI_857]